MGDGGTKHPVTKSHDMLSVIQNNFGEDKQLPICKYKYLFNPKISCNQLVEKGTDEPPNLSIRGPLSYIANQTITITRIT